MSGCARLLACWSCLSALPLLVASGGRADDHHAAVATDDAALVADRLDAWLDLHSTRSWLVQRQPVKAIVRSGLLVAVDDASAGQVVGRELHDHPVLGQDADV